MLIHMNVRVRLYNVGVTISVPRRFEHILCRTSCYKAMCCMHCVYYLPDCIYRFSRISGTVFIWEFDEGSYY